MSEPSRVDGRVVRGERTREAIVAAHTALLREGELRPTAAVVAARAGVSVRSLWQHFGDLEGLLGATTAWWLAADDALAADVDPGLPLAQRIDLFTRQRAERLESIAPAARSSALGEPFSAALAQSRRTHVSRLVDQVGEVFAPELAGAQDHVRHAVEAAASIGTWLYLRDDRGLAAADAESTLRDTLTHLLS